MVNYECCCAECLTPKEWCQDNKTPCDLCKKPMHPQCGNLLDGKRLCSNCINPNPGKRVQRVTRNKAQRPTSSPFVDSSSDDVSSDDDDIPTNSSATKNRNKATKRKAPPDYSIKRKAQSSRNSSSATPDMGHWCVVGRELCTVYKMYSGMGKICPPVDGQHKCHICGGHVHMLCAKTDESKGIAHGFTCFKCSQNTTSVEPTGTTDNDREKVRAADSTKDVGASKKGKKKKASRKKQKKNLIDDLKTTSADSFLLSRVAFRLEGPKANILGDKKALSGLLEYGIIINGKKYLFGTITSRAGSMCTKTKTVYSIEWENTAVGTTNMDLNLLTGPEGALQLAKKLTAIQDTSTEIIPRQSIQTLDEPPPLVSDDDGPLTALLSDDEDDTPDRDSPDRTMLREVAPEDLFLFPSIRDGTLHESPTDTQGLEWQYGGTVGPPTTFKSGLKTKLNQTDQMRFTSPLDSMLAFFPIELWKLFVLRTNQYARWMGDHGAPHSFPKWSGDTNLSEMMNFISILLEMTLYPQPGRPFDRHWEYANEMSLNRFKELRAALSVSEKGNDAEKGSKDALFRVRPLLNTLKATLGMYLVPGTDLALDESSVACRSKYGRNMIFFNSTKPSGKYHFRFYLLCETEYFNCLRIVVATKTGCDNADGFADPQHEESDQEEEEDDNSTDSEDEVLGEKQNYTKTTKLVLDICSKMQGTGRVVNTDNYYTSPQLAIALKNVGIYFRGTCRRSRKMFPNSVTFSKKEAKKVGRGKVKIAVNQRHGLTAMGWTDGNAVHFLSSVDGNTMTTVNRRIGCEKKSITAPIAIKRYNKGMQGVDRFDQLMSLFSLASRHPFKKWYKKMMMALLDIGLVNAEQHYWMKNKEEKKNNPGHRYTFRKQLITEIRERDWSTYNLYSVSESGVSDDSSLPNPLVDNLGVTQSPIVGSNSALPECQGIAMSNYSKRLGNGKRSYQGVACQVCLWEERGFKTKSVMLSRELGVRSCFGLAPKPGDGEAVKKMQKMMAESDQESLKWLCPDSQKTCWDKLHHFYWPKGLWSGKVKNPLSASAKKTPTKRVRQMSELYKLKEAWLIQNGLKKKNRKPGPLKRNITPLADDYVDGAEDNNGGDGGNEGGVNNDGGGSGNNNDAVEGGNNTDGLVCQV